MLKTDEQTAQENSSTNITDEIHALMKDKTDETDKDYPADPEYNPDIKDIRNFKTSEKIDIITPQSQFGEKPQKISKLTNEELAIDELLISVPRAQGYYLKLSKEIRPGEWQFKIDIHDWETWTDLELEVAKIIKQHSIDEPLKWGTGKYRIIVWSTKGIRGQKRPPTDFLIDAGEPRMTEMSKKDTNDIGDSLDHLSRFSQVIASMTPKQASPDETQKIIAEAVKTGQAIANENANTEKATMATVLTELIKDRTHREIPDLGKGNEAMAAMMTAMMNMQSENNKFMMTLMLSMNKKEDTGSLEKIIPLLASLGLLNNGNGNGKGKSDVLEQIKVLKELGLFQDKKESGLENLLNQFALLKDVMGDNGNNSESDGSILNTLVKGIAPKLPEMIGNVTNTINNVVDLNKKKLAAMQNEKVQIQSNPVQSKSTAIQSTQQTQSIQKLTKTNNHPKEQENKNQETARLIKFVTDLRKYVYAQDFTKFDEISNSIKELTKSTQVEDGIKAGLIASTDLRKFIENIDKLSYVEQDKSKLCDTYFNTYIEYVRNNKPVYQVVCDKCGELYNFESEQDFNDEQDKTCGYKDETQPENITCDGLLRKLTEEDIIEDKMEEIQEIQEVQENNDKTTL